MIELRRRALLQLGAFGVPLAALAGTVFAQAPVAPFPPNIPPRAEQPESPKPEPKLLLEENQKDMKKDVERLYQLASELKTEVERTDSVKVLSLSLIKKTEEIEKLAKEIRSRAKG